MHRRPHALESVESLRVSADIAETGPQRASLAVTEIECRRGGIDYPSFLILDEYNRFLETEAFDLETPEPIGAFNATFMRRIALSVKELAQTRWLRAVTRR